MAHATHEGPAEVRRHGSTDAVSNPLLARLPVALTTPWAWFAAFSAASFLINNQMLFDSRYAELAAHGFIGACAVLAGKFAVGRIRHLVTWFGPHRYANGVVASATIIVAVLGSLIGFQAATLYTREMVSSGANRLATMQRQREWLKEKTKTNLIRPDHPYHLGIPKYQYINLSSPPAR
ncbi:Transmembrane protein [Hyphomicrobium sp. 1Nfss2.1]|uniref:hypothetical protein n=1 Tax=Hyphomicrobium sp. 1Nfss2.1 TaxID=3413936 RepID=UPI003C7A08BD